MDSLKTLMDKKQYDLVLKLTENSTDINYLFYRISAFLATGKADESLKCINENRHILESNLSILIKVHIEILCLLGLFDEAYEEMEYYKNLPYVSQQVEELLRDLPKYIREEERKLSSSKELNDEKVKEMVRSSQMNDVIIALDIIRDREVKDFLEDLKYLMVNHNLQSIRSFSLFVLVQKKVKGTFKFKHIDKIIEVDPSSLKEPFADDTFNAVVKKVSVEFNNPPLSENAIQLLSTHVMFIYPETLPNKVDELVEALFNISSRYLQTGTPDIKNRCLEKGLDLDEVNELIDTINYSLENF